MAEKLLKPQICNGCEPQWFLVPLKKKFVSREEFAQIVKRGEVSIRDSNLPNALIGDFKNRGVISINDNGDFHGCTNLSRIGQGYNSRYEFDKLLARLQPGAKINYCVYRSIMAGICIHTDKFLNQR